MPRASANASRTIQDTINCKLMWSYLANKAVLLLKNKQNRFVFFEIIVDKFRGLMYNLTDRGSRGCVACLRPNGKSQK